MPNRTTPVYARQHDQTQIVTGGGVCLRFGEVTGFGFDAEANRSTMTIDPYDTDASAPDITAFYIETGTFYTGAPVAFLRNVSGSFTAIGVLSPF